ncbi:MAG: HEAT repeat domain-containing protein [Verrucomicrobiae bacterium]|nr:HEAT repeat domain-containing protein [Verrucomicrobiae bacterium]
MKACFVFLTRKFSTLGSLLAVSLTLGSCETNGLGRGKMSLDAATKAKALEVLREGLHAKGEDQFWVSIHAAEGLTLAGEGKEVRAFLEPKLATDHDAQHRCGLARELVRAGDREKVSILAEVLNSPDSYGHIHAAESLYKVHEVGDPVTMRRYFEEEGPIKLRLMAAAALARHGDLKAIAYIRQTLEGDDPDGIQISAWILGRIGNSKDIDPLRSRLPDAPTPLIKAYIEHALAALGDPDGLAALGRNLESDDPAIRTYAATFAGDAKAAFTQPKLVKMIESDEHLDARVRAAQTLLQLSR